MLSREKYLVREKEKYRLRNSETRPAHARGEAIITIIIPKMKRDLARMRESERERAKGQEREREREREREEGRGRQREGDTENNDKE